MLLLVFYLLAQVRIHRDNCKINFICNKCGKLYILVVASPISSNKQTDHADEQISTDEEDWHLIPDGEGKMHIANIHDVDADIEPNFVAFDAVVFRLFTQNNPTTAQVINVYNDAQLINSFFHSARQTRFTIHGIGFKKKSN